MWRRLHLLVMAPALLLAPVAEAGCDFPTGQYRAELADIASVRRIEVSVDKARKWARNGLRIITLDGEQIAEKYKRSFNGTVSVFYDFGRCDFPARLRQNGDFKDHVELDRGRLLQSLNIRLDEGNIAHAVRFKLFLQKTRNAENEVLATLLLSRLGFLAPRTRVVDVVQNGTPVRMLWQETVAKEFLEHNRRREGPMFEGDEALLALWSDQGGYLLEDLGLARVVNDKWAERGAASVAMTADAFTRLQAAYATYGNAHAPDPSQALTGMPVPATDSAEAAHIWWDYAAMMFAMRASHGLRPHNRKFYWNAFLQGMEPIYYDGEADPKRADPRYLRALDKVLYAPHFSAERMARLQAAVAALDGTDLTARYRALCDSGCTPDAAAHLLDRLAANLPALVLPSEGTGPALADPWPVFRARLFQRRPEARSRDIAAADPGSGIATAQLCSRDNCDTQVLDRAAHVAALSGAVLDGMKLTMTLTAQTADGTAYTTTPLTGWGLTLRHSPGLAIETDPKGRRLVLTQSAPDDWALLMGDRLERVEIAFKGLPPPPAAAEAPPEQRFNPYGLTGCLTLYGMTLSRVRISAEGGGCEDGINIVSSRGDIALLEVHDAASDAVDIDFADLHVAEARITGAGNDCLDLSGGHYRFDLVLAANCGDKAVSVGEASAVAIGDLDARASAIGISSKDGSSVTVDRVGIEATLFCHEVFRKKQEFPGAYLRLGPGQCNGPAGWVDADSVLDPRGDSG